MWTPVAVHANSEQHEQIAARTNLPRSNRAANLHSQDILLATGCKAKPDGSSEDENALSTIVRGAHELLNLRPVPSRHRGTIDKRATSAQRCVPLQP